MASLRPSAVPTVGRSRWSPCLIAQASSSPRACRSPRVPRAFGRDRAFGLAARARDLRARPRRAALRRADAQARWGSSRLCVALAGVFVFDLFLFADALLFGRLDAGHLDRARRRQRARHSVHRDRDGAQHRLDDRDARCRAAWCSTRPRCSCRGVFLLAVAGAGYIVRYFGGDWGRALQIELLFAAAAVRRCSSRRRARFRSKLRGVRQQALLLVPLRLPRRVAALHAHAVDRRASLRGVQEQRDQGARRPGREPRRRALARATKTRDSGRPRAGTCRRSSASEPADALARRVPARTGWVVDLAEFAAIAERYPELCIARRGCRSLPTAWLVVPLFPARELVGFVVLATPRATGRRRTGRCATC